MSLPHVTALHADPWRNLDDLFADVAALSRQPVTRDEFIRQLVERVCAALTEGDFTVWQSSPNVSQGTDELSGWVPAAGRTPVDGTDPRRESQRRQGVQQAQSRQGIQATCCDETDSAVALWSLAVPAGTREPPAVVLELTVPFRNPAARERAGQVLESLAELSGDYFRNELLGRLLLRNDLGTRIIELAAGWTREFDEAGLARLIVHDVRTCADCDRVSLLANDPGGCRVLAVSGADRVDGRGAGLRAMQELATLAVLQRDTLWRDAGSVGDSPEREGVVRDYFDVVGSRWVGVVPLELASVDPGEGRPVVGVLLVEGFTAPPGDRVRPVVSLVSPLVAASLAAARQVNRIPGARWWLGGRWQRAVDRRNRWWWRLAGGLVAGVIAVWPVRFEIEARGELQPRERREIFAPLDARVVRLHARHGAEVAEGELLLELQSPDLDLELTRVLGELEAVRRRLSALEAARSVPGGDRTERDARTAQRSGEEAAVREQLASLQQQLQLVTAQQALLQVRSPLAGRVLTWSVEDALQGRPVQRGQALLSIARGEGPWMLDLRVANRHAGHVLDASAQRMDELPVRYLLAIDPARARMARVSGLASSMDVEPGGEPFLRVEVDVERGELSDPRPGSGVSARIECGRRPRLYAWLHDLFDAVRGWLAL